jgi:tRNA G46 methylase TrmB
LKESKPRNCLRNHIQFPGSEPWTKGDKKKVRFCYQVLVHFILRIIKVYYGMVPYEFDHYKYTMVKAVLFLSSKYRSIHEEKLPYQFIPDPITTKFLSDYFQVRGAH